MHNTSNDAPSAPYLPLRCRCGRFQARLLHPHSALVVVCYCRDCQAFGRYLQHYHKREGLREGDGLDAHGGTALLASSPAYLHIDQGSEQLQAMSLSPKGCYRWYTRCCASPVAVAKRNLHLAHVSVPLELVDAAVHPVLPPVQAQANLGSACGQPVPSIPAWRSALALAGYALRLLARSAWALVSGRGWRGSPLVDAHTRGSAVPVRVLSAEERQALREP